MAYEKQTWVNGVTPIDADHLNHMEEGIGSCVQTGELDAAVQSALKQAKESGEFDGADGQAGKDGIDGKDGYSPFVSLSDYGATGDGVTDDSAAIQAAINENAYVVIPVGNYAINSAVVIPANRKLQIEGNVIVNGECGFVIGGSHIELCGNGQIKLPGANLECTAVRFLVDATVFFVSLREFSIIGAYSTSGIQQQSIAVEITGGANEGQCSFVSIECNIRSTYWGVYSHMASDQHADSWCTQINIDATIEQCVKAIDYQWGGEASRIRGEIQPRCNATEAGLTDATLVTLPRHAYMDAMIWDVDTARNNCILNISQKYCTVFTVLDEKYMQISDAARETLMLRIPTHNLMTTDGGVFNGNIQFVGDNVGLLLKKPDGTMEKIVAQENGLVTAGLQAYTNQLPKATDTDRTTIYGTNTTPGYLEDYRLSSSGNVVAHDGIYVTGFIPASPGSIVRIKNITITDAQLLYIIAYDANNAKTGYAQWNGAGTDTAQLTNLGNNLYDMVITLRTDVYGSGFDAIRISSGGFSADTIITVDELIDGSFEMVRTVNGRSGNVELSASDVHALPDTTEIPTVPSKVSEFENDAGYLTEHQDISGKVDNTEVLTMVGTDANGVTHTWTIYGKAVS